MTTWMMAFNRQRFTSKPGKDMDWSKFSNNWKNVDLGILDIINAIYLGYPYCPQMVGTHRSQDDFKLAQHIGIDMDEGGYESSVDQLAEHPLVAEYGAIIYPTYSHSHAAPRSRVLFLLDEPIEDVNGYRVAVETVGRLFPKSDPSCKDGARFFYGTKCHPHEIYWAEYMTDPSYKGLPVREIRRLYRQFKDEPQDPAPVKGKTRPVSPPPQTDESLEVVANKLMRVNSYSLSYITWVKTLTAMKKHYGDGAYEYMRTWSHRPDKDDLTPQKWNSLKTSTPVTIATVYAVIGGKLQ